MIDLESPIALPVAAPTRPRRRTAKYGFRVPPEGMPVPFRVLVSARWLWAGAIGLVAALAALIRLAPRGRWQLLAGSGGLGLGALALGVAQAGRLTAERVAIPVRDLPAALDGFTIAHLSDFHLGSAFTVANAERAMIWLQQRQPDLIVITGDFVSFTDKIPLLRRTIRGLDAPYGVYAVLGNHDYWTDLTALEATLRDLGIEVLRNEQRRLRVGPATLVLVGIDCIWEGRHDLQRALGDLPPHTPTVVLAHEPDIADEVARYDVALQLSGHTHAGHIALPGLGPLFLPRHGFRYFRGLRRVGRMWLYVSRGLGGIPLRLGCPPEVTELTLRTAE